MDKILVNLYVPIADVSYDVFIPQEALVGDILESTVKAVSELSDGRFFPDRNTVLCRRDNGEILNINQSVFELGIQNGSRLMLI